MVDPRTPLWCPICTGDTRPDDSVAATYHCTVCSTTTSLGVTNHALKDRWAERTDRPIEPEEVLMAWDNARTLLEDYRDWDEWEPDSVDIANIYGHRFVCDEARFHRDTQTVMLRKDTGIVTVIDATTARLNCKYSIVQTYIADDVRSDVIADVCKELELLTEDFRAIVDRERNRCSEGYTEQQDCSKRIAQP